MAQISFTREKEVSESEQNLTIEVENVDEVYARAIERSLDIVYLINRRRMGRSSVFRKGSKWGDIKHNEPLQCG